LRENSFAKQLENELCSDSILQSDEMTPERHHNSLLRDKLKNDREKKQLKSLGRPLRWCNVITRRASATSNQINSESRTGWPATASASRLLTLAIISPRIIQALIINSER
jgi:hypothetical protein